MHHSLAMILGTLVEAFSSITKDDYPGISKLRTQSVYLLQHLQGLVLEWTQNPSQHDISLYKPIIHHWIKSLGLSLENESTIFFTKDSTAIDHELRVFLNIIERADLISGSEYGPEIETAFSRIREWLLTIGA